MTRTCYICGARAIHRHHVFNGVAQRKQSERYKDICVIDLCLKCHENVHSDQELDLTIKRETEERFIQKYGAKTFMDTFHKNYLEREI